MFGSFAMLTEQVKRTARCEQVRPTYLDLGAIADVLEEEVLWFEVSECRATEGHKDIMICRKEHRHDILSVFSKRFQRIWKIRSERISGLYSIIVP